MFIRYKDKFPGLATIWAEYSCFQERLELPAKHLLLKEGSQARYYYAIESGAVRAFLTSEGGEDKTVQFFFEGDGLSSFESFMREVPSVFTLETLEPTVVTRLPREKVMDLLDQLKSSPEFMDILLYIFSDRQIHYMQEFVSFLRDSPLKRYENLIRDRGFIPQRVAQHYIASYLGISAVHLSRIKAKLAGR